MEELNSFIFDIDGVLVESEFANFVSLKKTTKEIFDIEISLEEDQLMGPIPTFKKIDIILAKRQTTATESQISTFLQRKFDLLLEDSDQIKFNREIKPTFEFLRSSQKRIGLVSNARSQYIDFVCKELGISSLVEIIVGNDSGFKPKPQPDMYCHAIQYLGNDTNQSIIFEDSDVGLTAARASGANVFKINSYSEINVSFIKQFT